MTLEKLFARGLGSAVALVVAAKVFMPALSDTAASLFEAASAFSASGL